MISLRSSVKSARPEFLAAIESPQILQDLRFLVEALVGPASIEVLPKDGPIVLARLRAVRPRLAFVSMDLSRMEGLTLLRALPAAGARRTICIVPDTLSGYRAAWEGLFLGARDFLVTRGHPPQRFRGSLGQRLRQLAHLLGAAPAAGRGGALQAQPEALLACGAQQEETALTPWIAFAETRDLAVLASWIQTLPPEAPVLVRIPEGPRLLRVAREGLARLRPGPVRILSDGDRLVPGHVHLFADSDAVRVVERGGAAEVEVRGIAEVPGTWSAHRELIETLHASVVPLRVLLPGAADSDLEDYLTDGGRGRHAVYVLSSRSEASSLAEAREVRLEPRRRAA